MIVSYWVIWWFSCQQARFLYIPLILMFVSTASVIKKPSYIFMGALTIALAFNFISILRAHYKDLMAPSIEVLRKKDRDILVMNREYFKNGKKGSVILDYFDAAYAQFPIEVKTKKKSDFLRWVLK